jgi:hypothetical protein|tara:strand:+ start:373 stop:741 length:369 start_codon:yes stop_codon:yes gene_type:complete
MFISGIDQYLQGVLNAKVDLTTTGETTLYTAPSASLFNVSIVSSIIVSNDQGSSSTLTVTITDTASAVFNIFNVKAVAANTSIELLTRDLVIKSGEIIKVTAADANRLHVVASIQEFTKVKN